MKNFVQEGDTITLPAPGPTGCKSGDLIIVGNIAGVAAYDAKSGAEVEVVTEGVFELPKATGEVNAGARVFWSTTTGDVANASSAGLFPIGVAVRHAGSSDTTVRVRLDGVSVAAAAGG